MAATSAEHGAGLPFGAAGPVHGTGRMTTEYAKLTWQEVRDADKDRVVILNVSATEDHGPHMPLDTDTVLGMAVADGVAEMAPEAVFVMPPIPYGFNEHHKDFPGSVIVRGECQFKHAAGSAAETASPTLVITIYNANDEVIGICRDEQLDCKGNVLYPFEVYITCSESHGKPHHARIQLAGR